MTSGGFGATVVREVKWRHLRRPIQVYNFVVSRVHNYLVGDGGIVVHNGSGTCTPNGPAADAADGGNKAADAAKNGGTNAKAADNIPKEPGRKPSAASEPRLPVHENFDSAADAIGDLNGKAELIEKSKTSKQFWIDQGYTEAHRVRDSSGTIHTVCHNPKTKKYSGGHTSHNQDD